VREVSCGVCCKRLGWFYEMAAKEDLRAKEGATCLELAMLQDVKGFKPRDYRVLRHVRSSDDRDSTIAQVGDESSNSNDASRNSSSFSSSSNEEGSRRGRERYGDLVANLPIRN